MFYVLPMLTWLWPPRAKKEIVRLAGETSRLEGAAAAAQAFSQEQASRSAAAEAALKEAGKCLSDLAAEKTRADILRESLALSRKNEESYRISLLEAKSLIAQQAQDLIQLGSAVQKARDAEARADSLQRKLEQTEKELLDQKKAVTNLSEWIRTAHRLGQVAAEGSISELLAKASPRT